MVDPKRELPLIFRRRPPDPGVIVLPSDLIEALDLIEDERFLFHHHFCNYCGSYDSDPHFDDCRPALFLRKHGRGVKIRGDKP